MNISFQIRNRLFHFRFIAGQSEAEVRETVQIADIHIMYI